MSNEDFFRHCWLTLKNSKPRLRKFMDQVECTIEGAGKIIEEKPLHQKEGTERKDGKPDQSERFIV